MLFLNSFAFHPLIVNMLFAFLPFVIFLQRPSLAYRTSLLIPSTTDLACPLDFAAVSHDDQRLCPPDSAAASHDDQRLCPPDSAAVCTYTDTSDQIQQVKMECAHCHSAVNPAEQYYRIAEMGMEFNAVIEEMMHREVDQNAILCPACFNTAAQLLDQNRVDLNFNTGRCVWCQRSLAHRQTHRLEEGLIYNEVAVRISPREIPPDGRICHACWMAARRSVARQADVDQRRPEVQEDVPMRYSNYRRTPNTASRCFVRGCINRETLSIPEILKRNILREHQLYVTPLAKICREHISFYNWDFLNHMEYISLLTQSEIVEMLQILSYHNNENEILDFENINNMDEADVHHRLGRSKDQFNDILRQLGDFVNLKYHKTILATYLMKLRTGEPNVRVAQLCGVSEKTVRRRLRICREYFIDRYIPIHLGVNHIDRNEFISHNLIIPEGLFGDQQNTKPITICDGTYIYMQKSSNYSFQKQTYSLHKYRNLVKPFLMVACDGHILDVFGPYAATDSDADIIKGIFQNNNDVRQYFQDGDIFILDKGFRDAINYLESLNYVIYKPESLEEGETQLSTIKANKSRLVTLCRWVVEVVNGRFKRDFKLFRNVYFNVAATHLMDDFRIAAAMINNYHPLIVDRPDASIILDRALQRIDLPNYLATYVNRENINRRRAQFVRIDGEIPHLDIFPQMEMEDLILFALGIYQIKQARSYYGEHIRDHGYFEIEVSDVPETAHILPNESQAQQLIRGRIKSRHQSQKIYFTYILINATANHWERKISGYYCNCIVGMRTVGCCAHVMTMVWYLSWARYQENIEAPATFLDGILVREEV